MKFRLKIGQVDYRGNKQVLIVKEGEAYLFKLKSAPKTTLEILEDCHRIDSLSLKIQSLIRKFGLFSLGPENLLEEKKAFLKLLKPISSPEIWAVGVTYKRQAVEHDNDIRKKMGRTEQLYHYVYKNKRAEVFFKGLDRTCQGPYEPITLRADTKQVLPEAEMVLVLGRNQLPVAYTLGNDLTAWDIERECPLYLSQAKIWDGSCSIGPYLVPADVFGDPYHYSLRCQVLRKGKQVVDSEGSTADLKRSVEELCYYLSFNNSIPSGTLLFTGTACVIPHDFCLRHGDQVTVMIEGLGVLRNTIHKMQSPRVFKTAKRLKSSKSLGALSPS